MHRLGSFDQFAAALSLLLIAFCFAACGDKPGSSADSEGGAQRAPGAANDKLGMLRVEFTDLHKHDNGIWTHNGELFSGQAVELAEDGETRVREFHYLNGRLHGPVREFYSDGSIMNDTRYEKGVPNGVGLEWDLEGNRTEIIYKEGVEIARFDKDSKGPKEN